MITRSELVERMKEIADRARKEHGHPDVFGPEEWTMFEIAAFIDKLSGKRVSPLFPSADTVKYIGAEVHAALVFYGYAGEEE